MVKTNSGAERYQDSIENFDSYQDIDTDTALSSVKTGVETGALRGSIEEQSTMLLQINDLLQKYENLKDWIKGAEGNRKTKNQLKHRLNENINDLKRMERDLSKHNYQNLTTYKARIWELIYYFEHYEQVRQIITLWWRTSDIHSIIDSEQDARMAKWYEKSDARYQERMNRILHDAALTSLWNDDMERYEEYLEAVVNWQIEPSSHPFYKAHRQSFRMIECTNPSLYKALVPSWNWRVEYVVPVVWRVEGSTSSSTRRISSGQREAFPSRLWKWFWELLWNIFPSIENNPRQRQAWEQFGAVAALWWAVFMWYKMLKNVFSKKAENPDKWWKAIWWWTWLLALTNGDRIAKWWWQWIQDAFNRHPSEKIQASTELFEKYWFSDVDALRYSEMHIWAPVATMSALHFIPIYELNAKKIVEYKNNEFLFNYDNYEEYINAYNWTDEQKAIVLAAWQKLRDEHSLDLWLKALGVEDQNKLNSLAGGSKTKTLAECNEVQTWWENCVERVATGVHKELFDKWLKPKDLDSAKKLIEEYNQNWADQIKKSDMDKLIIKWMNDWLLEVNTSEKLYEISDMISNSDINLEKRTIAWLTDSRWTPVEFESYKKLFDAAYFMDKYPLLKWLFAVWIEITDEAEAKKVEELLKHIKEWMKDFAPGVDWYRPYSISLTRLMFTTNDSTWAKKIHIPNDLPTEFHGQKRSLDEYPVIIRNRTKFLEFMNNKDNHMRGSEVSARI